MKELFRLVAEYLNKYPNSETPLNYVDGLGVEKLIELLEDGREIEFENDFSRIDWVGTSFK